MPRQPGVLGTGLPLVATLCAWPGTRTDGTAKTTTFRTRHFAIGSANDIQLVYVNGYSTNGNAIEVGATNSIRIANALEYPRGTVHAATFGGARTVTIAPGAFAISDPVAADLPAGALFWARQTAFQDGGTVWPLSGQSVYVGGNGGRDGDSRGWKVSDAANASPIVLFGNGDHGFQTGDWMSVAGNTAASGGELVMMPCAILGRVAGLGDRLQPWAAIVGDSIATDPASWNITGIGSVVAGRLVLDIAVNETRGAWFADKTLASAQSERRRRLGLDAHYVFCEHARNDIGNGATLAQMQSYTLSFAADVVARGGRCIASRLTPGTTSTDGFATAGNQTVLARENVGVAYNPWVRGGCGGTGGVWRTLDPCSLCEVNAANVPTTHRRLALDRGRDGGRHPPDGGDGGVLRGHLLT